MSAATEVGLQVRRLAIDVDTHRLAMLLLAAGNAETVTIVAGVNGTPQPLEPPQPAPPPPPPPTDVEIPGWLRQRITGAETEARVLLEAAGHLAGRSRAIGQALVALNEQRGGDDRSFDRLAAATDTLTSIENDICAVLSGLR